MTPAPALIHSPSIEREIGSQIRSPLNQSFEKKTIVHHTTQSEAPPKTKRSQLSVQSVPKRRNQSFLPLITPKRKISKALQKTMSIAEIQKLEDLAAQSAALNQTTLDLSQAQLQKLKENQERLRYYRGDTKPIQEKKQSGTTISIPNEEFFNEQRIEKDAYAFHQYTDEIMALSQNVYEKLKSNVDDIEEWPEFKKIRVGGQFSTIPGSELSQDSSEEEDVFEMKMLQKNVNRDKVPAKRRFTKQLTSDIESLSHTQDVLTQRSKSRTIKTYIFENWTDTLSKIGANTNALKKLPNLLRPYEQLKLNIMITKQVQRYKEAIDVKFERLKPPSLKQVTSYDQRDQKNIQISNQKKAQFFKILKKELPNFIRSALQKIYAEKRAENGSESYISNIYGFKEKKLTDLERREQIRQILQKDAEEERQQFIEFFKGKILKKEVDIALFSLQNLAKKQKRRVVPALTGLTREKLINNKF